MNTMLSPLPLFIQFIILEMTLDIASLCWVIRGHIKLLDFLHRILISSNGHSTQTRQYTILNESREKKAECK